MNYRKFTKNAKAISPIFATLILIAIAVIAGVVVYMFTSGTLATMTAGGTAGTEKAAVQGITLSAGTGITVYSQSTNNMAITINNVIVKNTNGDIVFSNSTVINGAFPVLPADGSLIKITIAGAVSGVLAGTPYSITITSTKGGSFVGSGVVAGA